MARYKLTLGEAYDLEISKRQEHKESEKNQKESGGMNISEC